MIDTEMLCCIYIYKTDAMTNEMLSLVFSRMRIPFAKVSDLQQITSACPSDQRKYPCVLTSSHLSNADAEILENSLQQHQALRLILLRDALRHVSPKLDVLCQQHQERTVSLLIPVSIKRLLSYLSIEKDEWQQRATTSEVND